MQWQDTFRTIAGRVIPTGEPDNALVEGYIAQLKFVEADRVLRKWIDKINTPGGKSLEPEHKEGLLRALDNMQTSAPRELAQ